MKTYTIKQKMPGTGSIHNNIASGLYDRHINFKKGTAYAVVLSSYYASYYPGKGYTTHKTAEAAILQSNKMKDWSHTIIDSDGNFYWIDGDKLVIYA